MYTYIHTNFPESLEIFKACSSIVGWKSRTGQLDELQFETFHRRLSHIELCMLYSEHMISCYNSGWVMVPFSLSCCVTISKNPSSIMTSSIVTPTSREGNVTLSYGSRMSLKIEKEIWAQLHRDNKVPLFNTFLLIHPFLCIKLIKIHYKHIENLDNWYFQRCLWFLELTLRA